MRLTILSPDNCKVRTCSNKLYSVFQRKLSVAMDNAILNDIGLCRTEDVVDG